MNPTFIILMLLSCAAAVAAFSTLCSALYYRQYRDNGAYKLEMIKYFRIFAVVLVVAIALTGFTVHAATNCPECNAIAMNQYCEKCGALVEQNMHTCPQCGKDAYNEYCGFCGAQQEVGE
ncbi:MAG: hypothetical protein IJZ68_08700 [Bacteroidaceae bacterium]|nr:hypothetical protein [Bacteroidaceae bacterium]